MQKIYCQLIDLHYNFIANNLITFKFYCDRSATLEDIYRHYESEGKRREHDEDDDQDDDLEQNFDLYHQQQQYQQSNTPKLGYSGTAYPQYPVPSYSYPGPTFQVHSNPGYGSLAGVGAGALQPSAHGAGGHGLGVGGYSSGLSHGNFWQKNLWFSNYSPDYILLNSFNVFLIFLFHANFSFYSLL